MRNPEHCELIVDDDGTVLASAQVSGCLSDEARAALVAVVKAVQAMPVDPELEARQVAAMDRIRSRNARLGLRRG